MRLAKLMENERGGGISLSFNPLKTASLLSALGTLSLTLLAATPPASAIQLFAEGMQTPESISQIPDGFGSLGGNYLIPDFRSGNIWSVPKTGGTPTSFAQISSDPTQTRIFNGTFLPDSYGGDFVVAGDTQDPTHPGTLPFNQGNLWKVDENGNVNQFVATSPEISNRFITPAIAPPGFFSEDTLVATGFAPRSRGVYKITPEGTVTPFAEVGGGAWGLAFAPDNFGALASAGVFFCL